METKIKKCPHCAEVIPIDAKVCRYCRRNVDPKAVAGEQLVKLGLSMTQMGCALTILIPMLICVCLVIYAAIAPQ